MQYLNSPKIYKYNSSIYLGQKSKHMCVAFLTLLCQMNLILYDIPTQISLTFPPNKYIMLYCMNVYAYLFCPQGVWCGGKRLEICTIGLEFESRRTPLVRVWDSWGFTRLPGPTKCVSRVGFPQINKKVYAYLTIFLADSKNIYKISNLTT